MVPKRTIAFPFPPSRQTTILAPKRSVSLPSSPCLRPEEVCLIAEQDAPPKALTKRSVQLPTRRPLQPRPPTLVLHPAITPFRSREVCLIAVSSSQSPYRPHSTEEVCPIATSVQLPPRNHALPPSFSTPAITPSSPHRGLSHCRAFQAASPPQPAFHRRGLSNYHPVLEKLASDGPSASEFKPGTMILWLAFPSPFHLQITR
jgi:hypothetical protein